MNPDGSELLEQLRDIHAAPEVPWWPPAPGWWLLGVLLMILVVWILLRLARLHRARVRRRHLLEALASETACFDPRHQPQDFLAAINRLLKITAMRAFPGHSCGQLKGQEWADFLAAHAQRPDAHVVFSPLAVGPYQPGLVFDPSQLMEAARQWVSRHG